MNTETVLVLDFGGQYNQLIARCVRECNVYAEVHPYTMTLDEIRNMAPKGIIFTGGPNSVYEETSPHYDPAILDLGIPVLFNFVVDYLNNGIDDFGKVMGRDICCHTYSDTGRTVNKKVRES